MQTVEDYIALKKRKVLTLVVTEADLESLTEIRWMQRDRHCITPLPGGHTWSHQIPRDRSRVWGWGGVGSRVSVVLETEVTAGHHVAVLAVDGLRAWFTVLPVFYHSSDSPSGSICNLTRFTTSELSSAT